MDEVQRGGAAVAGVAELGRAAFRMACVTHGDIDLLPLYDALTLTPSQVRDECGARQVKDCEVALVHGNGGVLTAQCTVIFGAEAAMRA